jgi:hypothetical protein
MKPAARVDQRKRIHGIGLKPDTRHLKPET